MEHYHREQWLFYRENKLPSTQRALMEQHLQSCNCCLDSYISVILPSDIIEAKQSLSAEFNHRLLQKTLGFTKGLPPVQHTTGNRIRLLQYYAIAAVITVSLMAGGWFDFLAQELPKTKAFREDVLSRVEGGIPYGWSEKLLDLTTGHLDKMIKSKGEQS
ncbi:MAG: hypothetical protein ACYCX4_09675 [Bacillota bacterium]